MPTASSLDQPGILTGENVQMLDLAGARASDGRIVELACGQASNGEVIRIQAIRRSEHLLVRLLGNDAVSVWSDVPAATSGLVLGLAPAAQGFQVLLVGAREDLQMPIAASELQMRLPVWP